MSLSQRWCTGNNHKQSKDMKQKRNNTEYKEIKLAMTGRTVRRDFVEKIGSTNEEFKIETVPITLLEVECSKHLRVHIGGKQAVAVQWRLAMAERLEMLQMRIQCL